MRFSRYATLLVVSLLALAGCQEVHRFFTLHHHVPVSASASAQTEHYVLNIALAQLAVMPPDGSAHAATHYVKKLNAREKVKNPYSLTVLAMDYTMLSGEKFRLLIPASLTSDASDFRALKTVLRHLSGKPCTLQDMRLYVIAFTRPAHEQFSRTDTSLLRQQLADRQKQMLSGNDSLEPFDDATLDLKLVRVFMACHARDAAYMALENAKNALAQATAESADQAGITELSHEADALESELHQKMPYTL